MVSTDRLDEFKFFIQIPIKIHADKFAKEPSEFVRILNNYFDNIRGEARRNYEWYVNDKSPIDLFFKDMIGKIENVEDYYFKENIGELIYYEIDKSDQYCIKEDGTIPEIFAFHIYRTIQAVKKYFTDYLNNKSSNSERSTPYPSFFASNKMAPYNVFPELRSQGFISQNTKNDDFVSIFEGKDVSERIQWTGTISQLVYFIRSLHITGYISYLGVDIWLVTQKCFYIDDGKPFTVKRLRHAYKTNKTAELDRIIQMFSHRR